MSLRMTYIVEVALRNRHLHKPKRDVAGNKQAQHNSKGNPIVKQAWTAGSRLDDHSDPLFPWCAVKEWAVALLATA